MSGSGRLREWEAASAAERYGEREWPTSRALKVHAERGSSRSLDGLAGERATREIRNEKTLVTFGPSSL